MNPWIPVTNQMPNSAQYVLVSFNVHALFDNQWTTLPKPKVTIDLWNGYHWSKTHEMSDSQTRFEVSHWMPLPEPPTQEVSATKGTNP